MSWHNGPMLAFDTETTGIDPLQARIVSVCLARCEAGSAPHIDTWLIDPGIEIPAEAAAVHGITTLMAQRDGQPPPEVLEEVAEALVAAWCAGLPVVAMNAAYDLSVVEAELARHRLLQLGARLHGRPMLVIDPLVIDRHLDRYRPGKKRLEDLCRFYRVQLENAHTADADALAAARVAWRLAERFPAELAQDLNALQSAQARWHRQWAENFESWMRENVDPATTVEREWPLRTAPG
jgi:DNA polymerase III subunit epsilon